MSTTVAGFPVASISVSQHDSDGNANSATVAVTYGYAVVSPADNVAVPMLATFSMGAFTTHTPAAALESVRSDIIFGRPGEEILFVKFVADGSGGSGGLATNFSGTVAFTQFSGRLELAILRIQSSGRSTDFCAACSGDLSGFVDPFIAIDPAFLAANPGYSVIVAEGIGNAAPAAPGVPGVPEPATLALVGLGLAGMGLSRRKKA